MKWHNPGGDQFSCFDLQESKAWSCGPFTSGLPGAPVTFALGEQSVFAGLVGLGADWRLARNWAIRPEINDQIFKPEINLASRVGRE
jgi:hypothetical protein